MYLRLLIVYPYSQENFVLLFIYQLFFLSSPEAKTIFAILGQEKKGKNLVSTIEQGMIIILTKEH